VAERTAALLLLAAVLVAPVAAQPPIVSIIVDDLGDRPADRAVLELPPAVALSVLPHTPHGAALARAGAERGHEVLLHLPMEALRPQRPHPGTLTADLDRQTFLQTLFENLASVPGVRGVNNHMGSRLTRQPEAMRWVMAALKAYGGLYYVDSRTTHETVAFQVAGDFGLRRAERDRFLDNVVDRDAIRAELLALVEEARAKGSALAIGHPHPETLAVLAQVLPTLDTLGVRLVPVAELIERRADAGRVRLSALPSVAGQLD
jgi:polysaccharide deacetylase 2 family uncharacterized protein YibQ